MTHILVDANNLFFRIKHITAGDADIKGGMALHIILNSLNMCWKKFNGSHVVFALEGGRRVENWRYPLLSTYKGHREAIRLQKSQKELDDDAIYFEYINEFMKFILEKTNCTVLKIQSCEADDCIAYWIEMHKDNNHLILSTDTDFYQLIAPNVSIFNGVSKEFITQDGFFDEKNNPVINSKTKKPKEPINPEWELFKKCMLGDAGDNIIRAAPPRMRITKIKEAFDDRHNKGFSWNNLMLQTWSDHNNITDTVLNRYLFNKQLIDLKSQPDNIKELLHKSIPTCIKQSTVPNLGVWFMKFCHEYSLSRIEKNASNYVDFLNATY